MRTEGRTEVKNSVGRLIFVAVSVLVQVGWFLILVLRLNEYSAGISIVSGILALCAVLAIYGKRINAAYKMPWIMLILAFPVLGLSLYLLAGRSGVTRRMQKRFAQIDAELAENEKASGVKRGLVVRRRKKNPDGSDGEDILFQPRLF